MHLASGLPNLARCLGAHFNEVFPRLSNRRDTRYPDSESHRLPTSARLIPRHNTRIHQINFLQE